MSELLDEITGLPIVYGTKPKPMFIVCSKGDGSPLGIDMGYSIHELLSEAKASIIWKWQRKYPNINFWIEKC